MAAPPQTEKIPALVFASPEAGLKIAALTVLDRLIVALHRGGAGPITIVSETELPPLKRAKALRIPFEVAKKAPPTATKLLLARGNILVQTPDVRRCLAAGGTLQSGQKLLPLGIAAYDGFSPLEKTLADAKPVEAQGVARIVENQTDARAAERALWATMWSSADGFVDKVFNRPVGRFLSKLLIFTPISPNMISIASIIIGVIAALFLAEGSFQMTMIGAILFQLSAIIDCVDGDIARILFKESPLGKWIDLAGDQIVHVSVFAGIAFGVLRNGGDRETLWLGVSAVLGALLSFAVVLRGMKQPADPTGRLQKLIDGATSRDFSVIVLVLAFAQKLSWFLWMAGIGSHAFWLTALGLQFASNRQIASKPPR
jgi:phosphatidylglycerophosphate synthase